MNKIYRNVWSAAVGGWVAASEASKGRGKTGNKLLAAVVCTVALAMGGASAASAATTCGDGSMPMAGECQVNYNPIDNDGSAGTTVADGAGQTVTLLGTADKIALGDSGLVYPTYGELIPELKGQQKLSFGAQVQGVTTPDAITGGTRTVATFDSTQFESVDWADARADQYKNVGDGQYIGSTMLSAQNGGTAVFNVGDARQAPSAKVNAITMAAKDTKIAVAKGAGSSVEWASRNLVIFVAGHLASSTGPASVNVSVPTYAGTFTGFDGRTYTVTNVAELAAYNDALVAALRAGRLESQEQYDAAFKQAVTFQQEQYTYDQNINAGDELTVPKGQSYSMYVDGAGARGKVRAGAQIDQRAVSIGVVNGGAFEVEKGGSVSSSGNVAVRVRTGGSATNNGVITGGNYAENGWDTTGEGNFNGKYAEAMLVNAANAGSTFTNNGIMNVAGWNLSTNPFDQYAIQLRDGAEGTNNGTINIGDTNSATNGSVNGVIAHDDTRFTNSASGYMYIGRAAQYDVFSPESVADTDSTVQSVAIRLSGNAKAESAGRITIGSLTQNSAGFLVQGATGADARNSGVIDIYGRSRSTPLINAGMHAVNSGASVVINTGTINLQGVNGVGLKAQASDGGSARVQSSGVINVAGAVDPQTGLRNYGAWAEGAGASVDIAGAVNVTGDGAIGVHARNGGAVAIAGDGAVNMSDGKGQIGFFAHGPGSIITNSGTAPQDVTTQGSTLFRMEDGADFLGGVGTGSLLTASGADSTAVLVTGTSGSDVSAFNSGSINVHLVGQGATGVRVEGGAQGKITNPTVIDLAAVGAVAGIADGQKRDIDGSDEGLPVAGTLSDASQAAGAQGFGSGTVLVSEAALGSTLDGVTGYIARNGAEIANTGRIVFTGEGTTGIRVEAGARGTNSGSIEVGAGGTGIVARDASGAQRTVVNNSGDLVLNGGTMAGRTVGISASGANTSVNMTGGTIMLNGDGAIGVQATNGATVNLANSAVPGFGAASSDQILFHLSGAGSKINVDSASTVSLYAPSERSTIYRLDDGAAIAGKVHATASGNESTALHFNGEQTVGSVEAGSTLSVTGTNARGLYVTGGAQVELTNGVQVNLDGAGATAGVVDGKRYGLDGSEQASNTTSTLTNSADLSTSQAGAIGFVAQNQGKLVNRGDIALGGADSQGVRILSGQLDNSGDIVANGTAVEVQGADSKVANTGRILATDGKAAIALGQGAHLDLTGSGAGTIEGRGTAHGVLIGEGATGLNVDGAHIVVNAAGATGHGVENAAEIANLRLNDTTIDVADGIGLRTAASIAKDNSGTINVAGSGIGIAFQNADGGQSANALDLSASSGLTVNVTGADGRGIVANATGRVDTAVNVDVSHAAGGSALVLGDGVTEAINRGSLTSVSIAAPTVDAGDAQRFVNAAGAFIAASGTGKAVVMGDNDSEFVNRGTIAGDVNLGEGTNTASLDQDSTLSGTVRGGAADDLVTVKGNASFGAIDGIAGNDRVVFDGAQYTYDDGAAMRHIDTVQLSNNSTVTLKQALVAADDGTDSSTIVIDDGSTLAVAASAGAFVLNNPLQGAGMVTTSSGGQSFDFGSANADKTGADFTGSLFLGDTRFALQDQNTTALRNATLRAGSGSVTTVGLGEQRIGGLDIEGGTLRFAANVPDQVHASTTIKAETLDVTHAGIVQVSLPVAYEASPKDTPSSVNLLAQDDGNIGTQLVSAASITGLGGNLTLQDQNGQAISDGRMVDISQGGTIVAKGTYDYRLTTAPGDGLYVNWGLKQLDLQQGQSLTFSQDSGAMGAAADMSAKITGMGNLVADAGAGVISLSNEGNDYTGETTAATGTLRLDANNALGQTSKLNIANGAKTDLNGKAQTIGALNGELGSTLDFNGGKLTIENGGTSAGMLEGAGQLNVAGGFLDVQGANGALSAATSIAAAAQVRMNDVAGLGSGAIANAGTLRLDGAQGELVNAVSGSGNLVASNGADVALAGNNQAFGGRLAIDGDAIVRVQEAKHLGNATVAVDGQLVVNNTTDWTLANVVAGAGDFVKSGSGVLNIGDAVHHSGATRIEAGTLVVGDAAHPNRVLGAADAGEVTVAQGATLSGRGTVSGHVTNDGVISALNAVPAKPGTETQNTAQPSKLQVLGVRVANSTLTLNHGLVNRGLVMLAGPDGSTPGNVLHVKGDYVGAGGRLQIRTVMGDDASATDKLVIDGGRASGDTAVIVQGAGGRGAQTMEGIRVVETRNGGTTAADAFRLDASSTGYRQGRGTLVAGAYDYSLVRGGNGGQAEDWYLTSETKDGANGSGKGTGTDTGTNPNMTPGAAAPSRSYRPEVGAYLANRAAAMQMTFHTLHERQGEAPGLDLDGRLPGKGAESDANGWLRVAGTNSQRNGVDPMSTVDGSSYLLHGGADLLRFGDGGDGSVRIGAMGMYGHTNSTYQNKRGVAQGQLDGYSAGVYGTWYGNQDILSGPYVDAWVMGGRYRNSVQGQGLAKESYSATGVTASIEAGYSFKLNDDGKSTVYLEPQAQVIVSNYNAGNYAERSGTVVSGLNDTQVTTRVGVRLHGNVQDDGGNRQLRPFAELNWWHGTADATMRFNGDVVADRLPSNRIEAKVGLQGNLSKNVSAWGALGGEVGGQGYRAGKIQAGLKYSW
ncbi:autotransporter outer membrane beta-barrel domain-containing protein [Variovorax dokdonensis]|uniref:Autotransporter outer membrane beta-barrel domain-containing protein n=1 Tax=Variovorax dokdonensis TaxID=344883 RepID=A0ABT7NEB7_9BURK|nr:autotransporter outer membrane beta-barrel domain-containing protein [Variovorax dokdonensis]MDM0046283.1 autotransporter outer membrane beta-barrel domain-containing protein [Variovorax dokdonensis]